MERFEIYRKAWQEYLIGSFHGKQDVFERKLIDSVNLFAQVKEDFEPDAFFSEAASVQVLALAYKIPGTSCYNNAGIKEKIIELLWHIYKDDYNPEIQNQSVENWWLYEVGIPLRVFNTLFLMYDDIDEIQSLIDVYTSAFLCFKDEYSKSSRGKKETGANLVWKASNLIMSGILRMDDALILEGMNALESVFCFSNKIVVLGHGIVCEDGFYEDGSFIQHYMFAYNGGYGKHLLSVVAGLVYAFRDIPELTLSEKSRAFLMEALHKSYEPLIWKGHFMDIARGRECARPWLEDDICGRIVMRAILYLTYTLPEDERREYLVMLKNWLPDKKCVLKLLEDENLHAEYSVYGSLAKLVRDFTEDMKLPEFASGPSEEITGFFPFKNMCKPVYRTREYALALSMFNSNIACFERLGHEGDKFWHFSDGQVFLYNEDSDSFSGDYYGTVDMQRLPGTTIERSKTREQDPYISWYLPESRNEFDYAGSLSDHFVAIAATKFKGQGNGKERNLTVQKSWYMFGKEIVCLGSGITSDTGNTVETVVENRKLRSDAGNRIVINGELDTSCEAVFGNVINQPIRTLLLGGGKSDKGNIGWYFPEETLLQVLCEKRTDFWVLDEAKRLKTNNYMTAFISHGRAPKEAGYQYVILPGATKESLELYDKAPEIKVVACDTKKHAVECSREHTKAITFFEAGYLEEWDIASDGPALVIIREKGEAPIVKICDPTSKESIPKVIYKGKKYS